MPSLCDHHFFEVTMLVAIPDYGGDPEAICVMDYHHFEPEVTTLSWREERVILEATLASRVSASITNVRAELGPEYSDRPTPQPKGD